MSEQQVKSEEQQAAPSSTSTFLSGILHRPVTVKLTHTTEYRGVLSSIDGYMNVVLENAKEIAGDVEVKTYSEVFLRGNNVLYISQD